MNPGGSSSHSELADGLRRLRTPLALAAGFGLLGSFLVITPSLYMFEVYGRAVESGSVRTLALLSVVTVFLLAIMELMHFAQMSLMREIGARWEARVLPRLMRSIYVASLVQVQSVAYLALKDWRMLRDFMAGPFLAAVLELPVALLFLAITFWIHPLLGWTVVAALILQGLLAALHERLARPRLNQANRALRDGAQLVKNTLDNFEFVRALRLSPVMFQRWNVLRKESVLSQAMASARASDFKNASKVVQMLVSSALLGIAAWLVIGNQLPGGAAMMVVASMLGGRVLTPLVQIITYWSAFDAARESWHRLSDMLAQTPLSDNSMRLPPPRAQLSVENLVVQAPARKGVPPVPLLRGIQFRLQPGDALGVLGASGAGKSTLARALVGLTSPVQGHVRLDGADISRWNKDEVGRFIGYLPQQVELIDGTIADNISRLSSDREHEVEQMVQLLGLQPLLKTLPHGLQTPVEEGGSALSGGQRQWVGLARAFFGYPVLTVLDEPNASLDIEGDQALVKAILHTRQRGGIVIVMTHRGSVLAAVNKMLVLNDGQQVAFGPRDEVLKGVRIGPQPEPLPATDKTQLPH